MRALIVDDDETFCQLLAETLERQGMEVEWTTESPTGYELAFRRHYDLCILDVRMPLLSGIEFAEKLQYTNPKAAIVLISAFADETLRETASRLGVPLLSKPFSLDSLLQAVAKLLSQGGARG